MTRDRVHGIEDDLKEMYLGAAPERTAYPGGVAVRWADFEGGLAIDVKRRYGALAPHVFSASVFLCCYGDLAYPAERMDPGSRVSGLAAGIPLLRSRNVHDLPPGYVEILRSANLPFRPVP